MGRSRRFGQHFLKDSGIVDSIIEFACLNHSELVLEIGPGRGILTRRMAEVGCNVIAIELDKRLIPGLEKDMQKFKNVEILQRDALSFDFSSLPSRFKVVSNLPYNISTPLTIRLLEYGSLIKDMILMYQREVAERLCALPGEKAYGSLSIAVQYQAEVFNLMKVYRKAFSPIPKVESTIVRITPRKKPPVRVKNEKFFFQLVKTLFAHRRKTIANNLKSMDMSKKEILETLDKCLICPAQRAESLDMEDFARLANRLFDY